MLIFGSYNYQFSHKFCENAKYYYHIIYERVSRSITNRNEWDGPFNSLPSCFLLRLLACIKPKSCARCARFELLIPTENSRSQKFFIDLVRPRIELNHDSCFFFFLGGGGELCHWRYLAAKSQYFDTLFYLVNY